MLKATRLSAVLLGLLTLGVFLTSAPAYAEVQNIRVGGDITVRAFHRENLDLHFEDAAATSLDEDNFLMSTVGVNVGADLTENVAAFVRIANERDWNVDGAASGDMEISHVDSDIYLAVRDAFDAATSELMAGHPEPGFASVS